MRHLGVPCVRDRVVQASIKLLLEPIIDPAFSDSSFGFRPGRSQKQAIEKAQSIVNSGKKFEHMHEEPCTDPSHGSVGGRHPCSRRVPPTRGDSGQAGWRAIRARFPDVRIIFRGDSDFCRESILKQCEILKVKYITGMAGNTRLLKKIDPQMVRAEKLFCKSGVAERVFSRFSWKSESSWSRNRDLIAKQVSGDETRSLSSTIRLRMLKVLAAVKITVRRVWISLPSSFFWRDIWIRKSRAI